MAHRLRGQNSAALASSIFLVCRKRKVDAGVGIADEVRQAIEANVRERLDTFWAAGLRGADFFISAIGPATAAFSRYDKVIDLRGNEITVSTLLEWVQQTVADYALRRVFAPSATRQDGDAGLGMVDDQTRFYVLWRWTYDGSAGIVGEVGLPEKKGASQRRVDVAASEDEEATASEDEEATETGDSRKTSTKKIDFGDAHLMATALGADVGALINRHHILEGSSSVRLMGAEERQERLPDLGERRADGSLPPLVDLLHRCELLWAEGSQDELDEFLDELAAEERETLRRVAQALVDLLPRGDLEKQRLEGFLYGTAAEAKSDGRAGRGRVVQYGLGEELGQYDTVVGKPGKKKSAKRGRNKE